MDDIRALLRYAVAQHATDLHLVVGAPPMMRVAGDMKPISKVPLGHEDTKDLCYSIMTPEQHASFERDFELDYSFQIEDVSRFRANVYFQRGGVAAAYRVIPYAIPSIEVLGLPPIVQKVSHKHQGLVLVTGATGSGKSTTLAAMIDFVNRERHAHIITIEDPLEYVHTHQKSIISQRDVRVDTRTFSTALKYVLRQDPDVVLIGEMRDLETMEAALTISETGHLTFATLHTNSAVQAISRIIDVFPPHQQAQVRSQLAFVLEAVFSQLLLPRIQGGVVLAMEVLIMTPGVRSLIRDGKLHQIQSQIQVGRKYGMQTLNQALADLVNNKIVRASDALERSSEPDELRALIQISSP